jgi:DNA helicase-2/ATP-dependent DNA helicase PcrA
MTRARSQLVLTGAARRRIFGEYQSSDPSRFIDEVPAALVERVLPAYSAPGAQGHFPHYEFRTNPYGRGGKGRGGGRFREDTPTYDYENEDQSAGGAVRPGMRVRHAQFGVGNVIAVEDHADDIKVTVRFNTVGVKKLLAKFAKLEPA